jgi:hypothetical protein
MNEEEIRNLIKSKLQNMSKEQLIDMLTDIYMESTVIRKINAVSSMQRVNMRINTQFAPLNQTLNELYYEKGF